GQRGDVAIAESHAVDLTGLRDRGTRGVGGSPLKGDAGDRGGPGQRGGGELAGAGEYDGRIAVDDYRGYCRRTTATTVTATATCHRQSAQQSQTTTTHRRRLPGKDSLGWFGLHRLSRCPGGLALRSSREMKVLREPCDSAHTADVVAEID